MIRTNIGATTAYLLLTCVGATLGIGTTLGLPATPEHARRHHPERQELIGTWRLVTIELKGHDGIMPDPFYQAGSVGLLVYDAGGRMSVQIAAPHRPAFVLPSSRTQPAAGREAVVKASAFDSYYAYYGTWTFDAAASAVTHHVESSLLPAEIGVDYNQDVTIDGDRLIFTNRDSDPGNPTTRTKVWQRASDHQGA